MLIFRGDLIESSKNGTVPAFEYCTIYGQDSVADSPANATAVLSGTNLSSYFQDSTLDIFEHRGLHRAVRAVAQATLALNVHIQNKSP
jgi:hypothetical protein